MAWQFSGRSAIVTGAASGIGRAVAVQLAAANCAVALVDRDAAGLARAAREIGGDAVSVHPLDLTDADAVAALPAAVLQRHGRIDILVNNAGIAAMGRFDETSAAMFDTVMAINFGGTVAMTRAVLPHLPADGRIANLSSIFGIVAPPGQVAYAASKFAVRGFTEALRHELSDTGVRVTVVHPGGVRTAIATNAVVAEDIDHARADTAKAAFSRFLKLSPETAATRIVGAIARGKPRLLIGRDAHAGDRLVRLLPQTYGRVLSRIMGGMREHVGTPLLGAPIGVRREAA